MSATSSSSVAAVMAAFGEPLAIYEIQVSPPMPREVVIRTRASGICHSDRSAQMGLSARAPRPPIVLGHEVSGVVERVGAGVTAARVGDNVVACAAASCDACSWCRRGKEELCTSTQRIRDMGDPPRLSQDGEPVGAFVGIGGFASHVLVHEQAVVPIPPSMALDRAAILACAVHTGIGAVRHSADVKRDDRVVVIGCGGVGLNVVQGARLSGARAIVGVDLQPGNLQKAKVMGATDTFDAANADLIQAVVDATDGGADHVFDVVGRESTLVQALAMTRPGGTVTMVGLPDPGSRVSVSGEDLFAEKKLQGHKMGRGFRDDIAWYCRLYSSGDLFLDELIAGSVSLDGVNEALSSMDGATGRTLIAFEA